MSEGDYVPIATYSHHQNDSCIKMSSDESHFNVSLITRDKVTRPRPQTTTVEEKGEPKRIRTEALLLTSLTDSQHMLINKCELFTSFPFKAGLSTPSAH